MGRDFLSEVYPAFLQESREVVPDFDSLPQALQEAILSAVYRGDLKRGHITAQLLRAGKYEEAAEEYLDHEEYKKRKRANPEDGIVKRMERNAQKMRLVGMFNQE